jgi:hypothetical protein
MLLGPSRTLYLRRKVKQELIDMGYKPPIIMEDASRKYDNNFLDEKFENIINDFRPDLFFTLFHSTKLMYAVIFEIGYIRGRFQKDITKKLRFLGPEQYDWHSTTAYIAALAPKIGGYAYYNERKRHYKASEIISRLVAILQS